MFRYPRSRKPWAILLTVVVVLGLGGCRSAVEAQQSTATESGPVTAGGELRVGVIGDLQPKTFLQIGTGNVNGHVLSNVFDTLVTYDHETLTPHPSLATSWTTSADGRSLTLTLRDGVKFHNGRPFTSADVRASLLAYLAGPWTPQFTRTAAAITDYDVSDPHRVVLTLAHPVGNIFDLLDSAPILDASSIDELKAGKAFNGTGPFRFDSWTPNTSVRLTRNPDYWGGPAPLTAITFVEARDPKSLYTRLRTGQLDVANGLTDNDHEIATRRYGFRDIALTSGETQVYVGVNVANPALADRRVRRAIAFAVDRERIIKDVYRGSGYAVNLPWPRTSPAFDEAGNRTYRHDVNRARAILREVGSVPPIDLDYTIGGSDRIVAEIVQSNLREIGITVNLVPNDRTIQSTKLIGGGFSGLWILRHAFAQYTPSTLAVSAYPFNAAKNSSNYTNPEYTAASEAAWKTADPESPEALAAYRRLDRVWLEDLFLIEIGVVIPRATAAPTVRDIDWDRRDQFHFSRTNLTTADRRS
ncbi:ABC transporter substrate-binding protein [Gordonia hydrophobica]|uniref:ABC transporter substrate-binding protein n=1 Tax=Gordonia hydrophobica TaxID=40516 RepID=A0ABZ2U5P8_9ACTN|nr:ABC transporter substrate-binding protein [Gordonia hydrophobica]MBM7368134.1 peptide/nickel transport system substrate-binding protein [Gordonia hydrophobica]